MSTTERSAQTQKPTIENQQGCLKIVAKAAVAVPIVGIAAAIGTIALVNCRSERRIRAELTRLNR